MSIAEKFTEKFLNDLEKFSTWINESDYSITDIVNGSKVIIDITIIHNSLKDFEEPPRNKMKCYIKHLMTMYFVHINDNELDDIKQMIDDFNLYKPKRKRKTKKESNEQRNESNEQQKESKEQQKESNEQQKESNEQQKESNEQQKNQLEDVLVNDMKELNIETENVETNVNTFKSIEINLDDIYFE
jgi:hypothetical protein